MMRQESDRHSFLRWFVLGTLAITALQFGQAQSGGGWDALLNAGEDHPARTIIESEVSDLSLAPGIGHDGQLFYVIGLDLQGAWVPPLLETRESIAYRYRRIGYPALASAFGLLDGHLLLGGMILVSSVSAGLAAGFTAVLARHFGLSSWLGAAVVLNPGVWISGWLLTADNLAFALGMLGVVAFVKFRLGWAVAALSVAVLTKEVAVIFALSIAGYAVTRRRRREGITILVGSTLLLLPWLAYLHTTVGGVFDSSNNIGMPFEGIVEAAKIWPVVGLRDNAWSLILITIMVAGIPLLIRAHVLLRWLAWLWIGVGLVSSHLVWGLGNNSLRTLAPVLTFTALGVADRLSPRQRGEAILTPASP